MVPLRLELLQHICVFVALADRLLEDRGVRGETLQSVMRDEPAQLAGLDQAALQIVEPGRLATCFELLQRVHATFSLASASCCFAAASMFSGVKPNFVIRSLSGAEAPNVRMPILEPVAPT